MITAAHIPTKITPFAKAGLIAKGIVYCLIGILAFMAAFQLGGQAGQTTDKEGVFNFVYQQTGGKIILGIIACGLVCYTIWRLVQAFADTENKGKSTKGFALRARYAFSGVVYASLALYAFKKLFTSASSSGSGNGGWVSTLLEKPFGQWMVGIAAVVIIGVGIYQIYYGLSEKYHDHVDKAGVAANKSYLLISGKIGYVARGLVWLIIGWMIMKAALSANAAEAGDTSKALGFLQDSSYGSYLLGAAGLGLCCYGIFNFVRARYESFGEV